MAIVIAFARRRTSAQRDPVEVGHMRESNRTPDHLGAGEAYRISQH